MRGAYTTDPNSPLDISNLYRNHGEMEAGKPWHEFERYNEFLIKQKIQNRGGLYPPQYDPHYPGFHPRPSFWEEFLQNMSNAPLWSY